jgi:signal transduction histidine kinase
MSFLLRDYILESSPAAAAEQARSIDELHRETQESYRSLLAKGIPGDRLQIQELQSAIEAYWKVLEPVLAWSPQKKAKEGPEYLLRRISPKRQVAFELARTIEDLNLSESRTRQEEILHTQEILKTYLNRAAGATLLLGILVAAVSISRTRSLEATAERHLRESERNASDLRRLSSKLSQAQEAERRSISRELHDQVGQTLTALRLELGNLEAFRNDPPHFEQHLTEARKLAEDTLRTVRDISLGLRPSVLDELGLAPALRWQGREFARRTGVPVDVRVEGALEGLDDTGRTCVYRVVQEALTNCARHAQAKHISVTVKANGAGIKLSVEDDGVGFDMNASRVRGLGLLGAEERVKELHGTMEVTSRPSRGTTVRCEIPVPAELVVA